MSVSLISVEDILSVHPLLSRSVIREELGAPAYIHRPGKTNKYVHRVADRRRTTVFYKEDFVSGFLESARFTHLVDQWEATYSDWLKMADEVSLAVNPDPLLSEQILSLRKLTKQIRRGGWFEQWLSNEVRHQLSNYDEVCKEFPEDVFQFVRPKLHSRIADLAVDIVPNAEDLLTVFRETGDSRRWMFAPVLEGLQEFTSFK